MRSIVVTGVSTGIGWGTTKVLIERGFHVFGSVRKQTDADRLVAEFGDHFTPLLFDVTDEPAVLAAREKVSTALGDETLGGLVNNAGIAPSGPLRYQAVEEFRRTLEVNLVGPLIVTQAFLGLLGADPTRRGKPGRIVNISSVGGQMAAPFIGGYAASKHGLEGFSESLRRELCMHHIDVVIVGPGSVATPIWDKAEQADLSQFANTEYATSVKKFSNYMLTDGRKGFPPEQIGAVVYEALTTAKPKLRYAPVPGRLMNWTIPRLLPRRAVDALLARAFALNGFRR